MTRSKRKRRPRKIKIAGIHARPIRGRGPKGEQDNRWYWQALVFKGEAGSQRTIWSGWATREEASRLLASLVAEQGSTPEAVPPRDKDEGSLRWLLEHWLADIESRAEAGSISKSTASSYRNSGRRLVGRMGAVEVSRLSRHSLELYRDDRMREGKAAATIDLDIRILRVAWRWGQERGMVPPEKLPRIRIRGEATRNRETPSPTELRAVIQQLRGWPRVAVQLLAATGARLGELAELKWSGVDLARGQVILHGKTGRRVVPLPDDIVSVLSAWRAEVPLTNDNLLGVKPKTVRTGLQNHYLRRACTEAGVPRFTPHGLRRYAVDSLMRAGVDIGTAAAILGHSPEVMLRAYRQATMDDMRSAVSAAHLGPVPRGDILTLPKKAGG